MARAKLGDTVAAVEAAICIHFLPDTMPQSKNDELYGELIERALKSVNSEILVCTGDELVEGKFLKKDLKAAHEFYFRADQYSGYMGAYALGRLHFRVKSELSERLFKKAGKNGHIPSVLLHHELACKRIPLFGYFVRMILALIDVIGIQLALRSSNVQDRFWRYQDITFGAYPVLDAKLREDRLKPYESVKRLVITATAGSSERSVGRL